MTKKSITAQERKDAPVHAGGGKKFPLGPGCEHVRAAWDLAGHASSPDTVRARVRSYAKSHGCSLPATASKAFTEDEENITGVEPDFGEDMDTEWAEIMSMFHEEIHMKGIDHAPEPDCVLYDPVIHKAFNPIGKNWIVEKSWREEDQTFIEGWVSTPDRDIEKDIVEPESFAGNTFKGYFLRSAPLSSNHNTTGLPIGHLQKGVLVRDGTILQTEYHPTDPAEFTQYNGEGRTGWYGRGVITDAATGDSVQKGNIGAFSWIGNLREYEDLPDGGRRYIRIDPLIESTVAAYPINPKAVMQVAKAFGLQEDQPIKKGETMTLEELLAATAARMTADQKAKDDAATQAKKAEGVTIEQIGELLAQFSLAQDEKIKKAAEEVKAELEEAIPARKAGVGRKGTVTPDPREEDPIAYITSKAKNNEPLDMTDKAIVWGLTRKTLIHGMSDSAGEDEIAFI